MLAITFKTLNAGNLMPYGHICTERTDGRIYIYIYTHPYHWWLLYNVVSCFERVQWQPELSKTFISDPQQVQVQGHRHSEHADSFGQNHDSIGPIHTFGFFLMKIICFYYMPLKKKKKVNIREISPLQKRDGDAPLKGSGSDCTCANTDYFITQFWCL